MPSPVGVDFWGGWTVFQYSAILEENKSISMEMMVMAWMTREKVKECLTHNYYGEFVSGSAGNCTDVKSVNWVNVLEQTVLSLYIKGKPGTQLREICGEGLLSW
jgi:hypothetical protein